MLRLARIIPETAATMDKVLLKHKVAAPVLKASGLNVSEKSYLSKTDKDWEG